MSPKRVLLFALLAILMVSCSQLAPVVAPTSTPAVVVVTATVPPATPTPPATQTPYVITVTPAPATATSVRTNTSVPTATSVPTNTPVPTATVVPPTATPVPTSTPAPSPTSEFPAGMGAVVVSNYVGQYDIFFSVNGKGYTIKAGGGRQTIFLAPGKYVFSANIPRASSLRCELFNGCTVTIKPGEYTPVDIY